MTTAYWQTTGSAKIAFNAEACFAVTEPNWTLAMQSRESYVMALATHGNALTCLLGNCRSENFDARCTPSGENE